MARRRKRYREEILQTMSRFLNDIDPSLFQVAPGGKVDAAKKALQKTIKGRFFFNSYGVFSRFSLVFSLYTHCNSGEGRR